MCFRFLLVYGALIVPGYLLQESSLVDFQQTLSPDVAASSENNYDSLNRKARKLNDLNLGGGLGVKHTVLNLIFGKINRVVAMGTSKVAQLNRLNEAKNSALGVEVPCRSCLGGRGNTAPRLSTTTEEVPQFPRTGFELELPGELLGVGYNITTGIARIVAGVVLNVADRKQQLLEAAKPFIAAKLGLDLNAPASTTTEPIELLVPCIGPPVGGVPPDAIPSSPEDSSASR